MLDVHPPHHAVHAWKDFFIHIATIVVGLLIAVGLEQTVEYFHHREQLHQLREDLHTESLRNLRLTMANVETFENLLAVQAADYDEILTAAQDHRSPDVRFTTRGITYTKAAYAAWTVAQQSGAIGLLSREEAQCYVRVYSMVEQASDVLASLKSDVRELSVALSPGMAASPKSSVKSIPTRPGLP